MKRFYTIVGDGLPDGIVVSADGWRPNDERIKAACTSKEAALAAKTLLTGLSPTLCPDCGGVGQKWARYGWGHYDFDAVDCALCNGAGRV